MTIDSTGHRNTFFGDPRVVFGLSKYADSENDKHYLSPTLLVFIYEQNSKSQKNTILDITSFTYEILICIIFV